MKLRHAVAAGLSAIACATAPPPRIFAEVDATRSGAPAREAERLAPQAHAHAEDLRRRAHRAFDDGDRSGSQMLSEHALAAYAHAFVLARLTKAERDVVTAGERRAKAEAELASIDEQQKRMAAEADALELRVKVARDALPLAPNAPAGAEREQARREAALAFASQARLLCTAARLVDSKLEGVDADLAKLDSLDKTLAGKSAAVPIDEAVGLRSACLKRLTHARRPAHAASPTTGADDALLAELGNTGQFAPFRDDRGVVVTLRGLFAKGDTLTGGSDERIAMLGRIAKAHAEFPVLVVVHSAGGTATDRDRARAGAVADALRKAGAARVEARAIGGAQPVLDPSKAGASARNERVEVVFVSPS